ncbi:MAG: ABC transporter ATP-binding protein [Alphaproteobacteria bacterium]
MSDTLLSSSRADAVRVENLIFDYPGRRALSNLSFHISYGSITALVGPNGAGKTTLLRCLAALDLPFSGKVSILGIETNTDPRAVHRRLGYLADIFGLYEGLTVRQCLIHAASLRNLPSPEIPACVTQAAAKLAIDDRLSAIAGTLSRGLRQRLAIAQAIIHNPEILLLDEPASGLDPEARQDLSKLLRQLQASGMTLVVSSHILAELEDYSTDMLILDKGQIIDHTSMKDHAMTALSTRRLVLEVNGNIDGIAAKLTLRDEVSKINAIAEGIEFQFSGDITAQANLLKYLIVEGISVSALWERRASFQDTYVTRVRRERGKPSP